MNKLNLSFLCLLPVLSGFTVTTTALAQSGRSLSSPEIAALALFGRANYFRVVTAQRRCDLVDADYFKAVNQRFENARQQLATKFGDNEFPVDKPVDAPITVVPCERATLNSYGNHVSEIEQLIRQLPAN
jgi:hypothetical protein